MVRTKTAHVMHKNCTLEALETLGLSVALRFYIEPSKIDIYFKALPGG